MLRVRIVIKFNTKIFIQKKKMDATKIKLNPRKTFWKCGACSNTMFHLLNHEFDNIKPKEEKASDMLAGGIAQKGHQCGMLWGGSLAIGTEAFRRYKDHNQAIASAINASKLLVDSFYKRTKTVNCRDIAKVDWDNKFDFAIYMLKTFARGFVFSPCFNLIVKWTPEATIAANNGLSDNISYSVPCYSCSTEVVKKMGGSEEESVMVAGLAGGIGLSGNACGALGAAIWFTMLKWGKNNQGKTPSMFNNPDAKKVIRAFYMQTDSEMLCNKICNRSFNSIDEHSDYIKTGGCSKLIEALSK
jgi:C_GCAxxG_C_C family probable redox protein